MTKEQECKIREAYEIVLQVWVDTGSINDELEVVLDCLYSTLNEKDKK